MNRNGQVILEFCLVFIIAAALILGLLGLWRWSNGNIPARQGEYERTRVKAGKKVSPGSPEPSGTVYGADPPPEPYYLHQ